MRLISILYLLLSVNCSLAHDGDLLASLMKAKAKEYNIKSITIRQEGGDNVYYHEKESFDSQGNRIDYVIFYGENMSRRGFRYDSTGRQTYFFLYDKKDTSKMTYQRKYYYVDSTYSYTEESSPNEAVYQINTSRYKYSKNRDTMWVEDVEKSLEYDSESKKISRYRFLGDSLTISEFIEFEDEGKMSGITAYYKLKKTDPAGNTIVTAGEYIPDLSTIDDTSLEYYYMNREEFFQKQLDGGYRYEYGSEHTYEVYNAKGQLIQDDHPNKRTFEYNSNGQLIKATKWKSNYHLHFDPNRESIKLIESYVTVYEYDERGLPISIREEDMQSGKVETFRYEYEFRD